jgi:hypothetical protein
MALATLPQQSFSKKNLELAAKFDAWLEAEHYRNAERILGIARPVIETEEEE